MDGLFALLVVIGGLGLLAWALSSKGNRQPQARNTPPAGPRVPRIGGNGRYSVDVVGESHHRASFEALLGSLAYTDDERFGDALLQLQDDNPHDAQAVAVYVDGRQVGHLSRQMARDFRKALQRDGFGQLRQVAVGCRIYGGGEEGLFSVTLDLPET